MTIDINKKYRTRDGRQVRIYATDGGGNYPIHGAFESDNTWVGLTWTIEGKFHQGPDGGNDLIEVQEPLVLWFNVYKHHIGPGHKTKEAADDVALPNRLYCKRVEFPLEEG